MITWYRPYVIPNDPDTYVAKYQGESTHTLRLVCLVSKHKTDDEAVAKCRELESEG